MLYSLRSIQQTRFDLNESLIVIRILNKKSLDQYNHLWECQIERGQEIISKNFLVFCSGILNFCLEILKGAN